MAKRKNTAALVKELADPVAAEFGLIVWDVQFAKEGPDWQLRIIIDKPGGGVSIDDCEKLSRRLDPLLDELDPTDHEYYLIVSSPGPERALKTDGHLREYIGKKITVKLIRPDPDGSKIYSGILRSFNADTIVIGDNTNITRKETASIKAAGEDWEEIYNERGVF